MSHTCVALHIPLLLVFSEPNLFYRHIKFRLEPEVLAADYKRLITIVKQYGHFDKGIISGPSTTQLNAKSTIKYFTRCLVVTVLICKLLSLIFFMQGPFFGMIAQAIQVYKLTMSVCQSIVKVSGLRKFQQ